MLGSIGFTSRSPTQDVAAEASIVAARATAVNLIIFFIVYVALEVELDTKDVGTRPRIHVVVDPGEDLRVDSTVLGEAGHVLNGREDVERHRSLLAEVERAAEGDVVDLQEGCVLDVKIGPILGV